MRREQLAALLWWANYNSDGIHTFDAGEYGGNHIDDIVNNFGEWTDDAKERNGWRRVAKDMLAQAKIVNAALRARTAPSPAGQCVYPCCHKRVPASYVKRGLAMCKDHQPFPEPAR